MNNFGSKNGIILLLILNNKAMLGQLISLKMKWYGSMFMKTIYEYTVAILIWGTVFVFGVFNLSAVSKPIADFLSKDLSIGSISIYMLAMNLVFMIFYGCQRSLLFNSGFESFIQTLPVGQKEHRLSSLFVLFISNHFLWLILLVGAYIAFSLQPTLQVIIETIYLIVSLLLMQLSLHERNITKFIWIWIGNFFFIAARSYLSAKWFNMAMLVLLAATICIGLAEIKSISLDGGRQVKRLLTGPVLSLQFAMLKPYQNQLLIKTILCIVIQFMAMVMDSHVENPNLIYFILLLNYLSIGLISSYSRLLALETSKMMNYFSSLPMKKSYLFNRHQVLNLIITGMVLMPCAIFALVNKVFSIGMIFYLLFAITVTNSVAYYIHFKKYRNTALLMSVTAVGLYSIQCLMR